MNGVKDRMSKYKETKVVVEGSLKWFVVGLLIWVFIAGVLFGIAITGGWN